MTVFQRAMLIIFLLGCTYYIVNDGNDIFSWLTMVIASVLFLFSNDRKW